MTGMPAWRRALLAFGCAAVLGAAPAGAQVVQPDITLSFIGDNTLYNEDRAGNLPFLLSRRLTRGEVLVDWRVVPRPSSTAIPGLHYDESFQTGTIRLWAGASGGRDRQIRFPVPIIDNTTGRARKTERFTVRLENLRYTPDTSSRSGFTPETVGYGAHREIEIGISADEHTISIDSPSVREGPDGETTTLDFTVTYWPLDEGSFGVGRTATATYAVTGGTATAGDDYVHTSGELVFTRSGRQTISVEITGDNDIEPNETVEVTINNLRGIGGLPNAVSFEHDDFSGGHDFAVGVGTIINDDGFTIDSPEVVEGPASATTTLAFEVTAPPSTSGSMIDYTVGGTAAPGEDYDASFGSGTLTFDPDEASKTLAVEVFGDGTGEDDETVVVVLSNPRGLPMDQRVITTATGTGTILNDDHAISLAVDQPSVTEGDTPQLTFTATMDRPAREVVTVEARLLASSTAERADFDGLSGGFVLLRFTPGQTSKTFTVDINDDDIGEADETVIVGLVNPVVPEGSTFVLGSAASTILNDDYTLRISSGEVAEGHDSSMTTFAFTVEAPVAPSGNTRHVIVDYMVGGTATPGVDYDASFGSGTLAFAVGEGSRTLEVEINGDNLPEDNETVVVTLSNPRWSTSGGEPLSITVATGTGTIVNDDYTLSIDSWSVEEGGAGSTTPLTFTVSLDGYHWSGARDVTVEYRVANTSTAGSGDYQPLTPDTLTFTPGVTEQEIPVTVIGDDEVENDETLVIELLNPEGPAGSLVSIAGTGGSGTIRNDDGALFAVVPPGPVAEGASGSSTPVSFTVTLAGREPGSTATVEYGVTGTATPDDDYSPPAGGLTGTLTFNDASATTSMPLVVTVLGDDVFEPDETVVVTLASPSRALIAGGQGEAVATIRNDDPIPLSIGPADGDESAATLAFDVTLAASSSGQVTFRYRTVGGTATPGEDFQAATGALVAIAPGATSARVEVAIVDDAEDEGDETVVVEIFDAAGAAILPGGDRGTGTIRDDDVPGFSIDSPRVVEGDAGPATLAFTVTLDRAPFQDATVTFEVLDTGSATEGVDYAAPAGNTRTIRAGATSTLIEVTVNGDTIGEPDETVEVMLTDASANATILQATGTGRILDDDPVISIGPAEAAETGSGTGESPLEFTVTMSKTSPSDVTVAYEVRDVTTTAGEDYRPPAGNNITIHAGATSAVIALTVLFDRVAEDPETLEVVLRSTAGGGISPSADTGTGTIFNSFSVLAVDGATVVEGDGTSTAMLAFRVTLDRATTSDVRFTYVTTMGGTAAPGEDFQPIASPMTGRILGGGTSTTAEVTVIGDDVYEGDETVEVEFTGVDKNSVFPGGGTAVVAGTIEDNELPPQLTVSARDTTATEPSAGGASTLVFTATLSRASSENVTAAYEVTGTAAAGVDYREPSGAVMIPTGATSMDIAIELLGDDVAEAPETLTVRLVSVTGGAAIPESGRAATIEILDHNPVLTIGEAPSVLEGGAGTTATLTFTVALDRLAASPVEFTYETTAEGTAEPGGDFRPVAPPRRASIPAGGTSTTATVTVIGDDGFEPDETVEVAFEIGAGVPTVFPGGVKTAAGTGTIRNDDRLEFAIDSPAPVQEGPSGSSTPVAFTVTLEGLAPGGTASVDYGLSGTATAGVDYDPPAAGRTGTLTFANDADATSTTVSETVEVTVLGDDAFDPDETVVVTLSNPSEGAIAAGRGRGEAVIDNDDLVSVSIGPAAPVREGAMGTTATLDFEVTLGAAAPEDVVVRYRTGTGGTATPGEDYRASTSMPLTIGRGSASGRISIPVIGDDRDEDDETVEVELLGAVGAMLAEGNSRRRAIGTIRDDDEPEFSIAIDRPAVDEGGPDDENPGFTFTVTLDPPSFRAVTVDYSVGGTAANGDDYGPLPGGRLTFAAGATSSAIVARVNGDDAGEDDETVVVTLSNPSGARIAAGRNEAVATIRNDDLTLTIDSPEETEAQFGTATLTFTVALSATTSEDVTVEYRIAGGTATAGEDYEAPSGTVTIPAGRTSATIAVTVNNDGEQGELPETVEIELARATSGALDISNSIPTGAGGRGKGTILDDEPVLTVGAPGEVEEGGAGAGMSLMFAVTLDRPAPSGGVTVGYSVGGAATQGVDYSTPSSGTLTFAPGATTTVLDIQLIGDDVVEPDETVTVTLSGAAGARFEAGAGMIAVTGTIRNDDRLELSVNDPPGVMEGAAGTTTLLTFTVSLSATTSADVAVGYRVGGTATAGEDYAAPSGAVTIPAGALFGDIEVAVVGDDAGEADETVVIELLDPPGETGIRKGTGTGTILNDDLRITIDSPEATEPGSGTVVLTFTVELSSATSADVEVEYRIAGGTATAGEDYVAPSGAVTIPANTTSAAIAVTVNSDGEEGELSETVVVELVRATSGGIDISGSIPTGAGGSGEGRILNDRPVLTLEPDPDGDPEFVMELDRQAASGVRVLYEVRTTDGTPYRAMTDDGMVTSGDGGPREGTFTIAAGAAMAVLAVEPLGGGGFGPDTLAVTLSNPTAGAVFPGGRPALMATGPRAGPASSPGGSPRAGRTKALTHVLAGVGRALAGSIVDLIWDRAESHRYGARESHATVGGRSLDTRAFAGGGEGGSALRAAGALAAFLGLDTDSPGALLRKAERHLAAGGGLGALRDWADLPDGRDLLGRSGFAVSFANGPDGGSGGPFTVWGRTSLTAFESGLEDGDFGAFSAEGEVMAGHLGFDYRSREGVLAGIALGLTGSSIDYGFTGGGRSEIETEIVSVHPYLHWMSPAGLGVWGSVGYGAGTAEIDEKPGILETDLTMQMAAGGVRNGFASMGAIDLAVKADAFVVEIAADEVADGNALRLGRADADSSRARLALEGSTRRATETGGVIAGRFEVGARYDGGDAEEGAGADIAAGFKYAVPGRGLELTGRGSLLLAHEEEDFEEWGLGLGLAWAPGPSGHGLRLSVEPGWGVPPSGAAASLWNADPGVPGRPAASRGASLDARLGYGLGVLDDRGLVTVFGELGRARGGGRLRLGAEFRQAGESGLGIELYGERLDRPAGPDHSAGLKGRIGF